MNKPDVLIVGAGLAGLCCARQLHKEGVSFQIVDASDAVGGRVRTDKQDGFLLDRGFQALQTAYPEALAQLDYDSLSLHPFVNGAMVRHNGSFHRMTDPWREAGTFLANAMSPVTHFRDKFRMWQLRRDVMRMSIDEIFDSPETSARQALLRRGFSRRATDRFFKPLLGGAMLDPKLVVSSRMLEFVFKMFSEGDVALPAAGMQAIPDQLAAALPQGSIQFHQKVKAVGPGRLDMADGALLEANSIVVATDGPEASRLLGSDRTVPSRSVCCLYFAAKEPPLDEPILVLSGSTRGPINNVAVLNLVAPSYAPKGEFLISVTILGMPSRDDQAVVTQVRSQMKRWWGLVAEEWRLLRMYRIEHGLPVMASIDPFRTARVKPGLYACGDHRSTPSFQGAMESGRLAAETLIRDLKGEPDPVTERDLRARARADEQARREADDD
ncbi:MAG TPA: NAD(P)/FAD-dependent oxidoreductase [Paludibaculum sp.]|jgi:phytoene dehydrogenase-like protein